MTIQQRGKWLGTLRSVLVGWGVLAFVWLDLYWLLSLNALSGRHGLWFSVYVVKAAIEFVASVYAIFYVLVAVAYCAAPDEGEKPAVNSARADISIVYLCCDDFDPDALQNLAEFSACTGCRLLVHDDSALEQSRKDVNEMVGRLQANHLSDVQVLRRGDREGGKPGAVNHVLQNLPPSTEYLLLCDSDSYLFAGEEALGKALAMFVEPSVAIVQFRNTAYLWASDGAGYRTLSESVNYYGVFVSFMDRFGWSPFLGHNALLRISALREIGGFTPGQLADDIDLSVRLRIAGYEIRYAAFLSAAERHPGSYEALRRRTAKWSYGCTQILLRWGMTVLGSNRLAFSEKVTFFLTVGYYHFQALLLVYLAMFYIVLPFDPTFLGAVGPLLVSAGLILFLTFLPSITYFLRGKQFWKWPATAACWGLTYGSQDLLIAAAIIRRLVGRRLVWVPTNASTSFGKRSLYTLEVSLGLMILAVAAVKRPALLLLPTTVLFAGKFLVTPWLNWWIFEPACVSCAAQENKMAQLETPNVV